MYLNKNIKKNSTVREKDLICLRPEEGLGSKNYFNIINKRAKKDLKKLTDSYEHHIFITLT